MVARLRLRLSHVICEEDCGPLLVSWAIALSAAVAWLLLVYLTPPAPIVRTTSDVVPVTSDGIVTVDAGVGYKAAPTIAVKASAMSSGLVSGCFSTTAWRVPPGAAGL